MSERDYAGTDPENANVAALREALRAAYMGILPEEAFLRFNIGLQGEMEILFPFLNGVGEAPDKPELLATLTGWYLAVSSAAQSGVALNRKRREEAEKR